MKIIDISKEEYSLLNRYIGQGKHDASLVFFGNEPGTSGLGILDTIKYLKTAKNKPIGNGFLIHESYSHPTSSDFARFISRLCLGLENKDDRWFGELSQTGNVAINQHIMKPISEKNICLINLRPLPRPTQDTWVYSNINKKDYQRKWNFTLKGHYSDNFKDERLQILKSFFKLRGDSLIIGVGDKENKRAFLEKLFPNKFHTAQLDNHTIYFEPKLKIILSNYFNNRNGIKLKGLKDLYNFIVSRNFA